jgi:hypothetical protein
MQRRGFILGITGFAMTSIVSVAQGIQKASVARPKIVRQECPEWCWAASASMIFDHLGHAIDQQRIVAAVYGGLTCQAAQPITITRVLSVPWIDDHGQQFQPRIQAGYDQLDGINTIGTGGAGNTFIVNELMNNRMLLYANTHHCMALVEVDYIMTPMGPNIINAVVLDPWPLSAPEHPLTGPDLGAVFAGGQMMYLAAVEI